MPGPRIVSVRPGARLGLRRDLATAYFSPAAGALTLGGFSPSLSGSVPPFVPDFYVSPTGGTGTGSIGNPWSLVYALSGAGGALVAGKNVAILDGLYNVGAITSTLVGSVAGPIVLRRNPGATVQIDGSITVNGAYTWFWGLESFLTSNSLGSVPGFDVFGPGTKLINCIIHDCAGNGVGNWVQAPDAEVYGCLLYNNGRFGQAVGRHAHGVYFQNSTGTKRLVNNIAFNNWSHNFHGYAETSALNNFTLNGNISFNAAAYTLYGGREYIVGGSVPVQNLTFAGNYSYRPGGKAINLLGYDTPDGGFSPNPVGSAVTNNYLTGIVQQFNFAGTTFTGNTVVGGIWNYVPSSAALTASTWDLNTYYYSHPPDNPFVLGLNYVVQTFDFPGWRAATGFDGGSTFTPAALPSNQVVVLQLNTYEAKRAHVVVYNWGGAPTALVDLSSVLQVGDVFEIREVQNYFGPPAVSGTYAGGVVALPMTAVTAPAPFGVVDFPALSTGTEFHAFVVRLQGA